MAFNPPVTSSGLPMRVEGEYMVLERKSMEIEVKVNGVSGKKAGKGKVLFSTLSFFLIFQ